MNRQKRFAQSVNALAEKRRSQIDFQEATETVVPYTYCTVVMALNELTDMTQEDINAILIRSQEIWDNWDYGLESPLDVCERLTGIRLMSHSEAREKGYE